MTEINEGERCLIIIHGVLQKHNNRVSLDHVIHVAESAGWQHTLTTFRQKRKHIYEVLRQAREHGKTDAFLEGCFVVRIPQVKH